MIVLKKVSKVFGRTKVLEDISFQIDPKEFICITGPSGAGKSSLISLLIGAEDVTTGAIEIDGVDLRSIPPPVLQLMRRRIGIVFQDYKLLPDLTVAENIAFPLEVCMAPDKTIRKRVPELLKRMDLVQRAGALPRELSGGEKARTAIARAIVHHPMILLADEPTGNLDPEQSLEILALLKHIHHEGTTVVLATHDAVLVDALQTRVIHLDTGRVMRDAVGGYDHARRGAHNASHHAKHDIFRDAEEFLMAEKHRGRRPPAQKGGHRKIKITAIHT